MYHQRNEGNHHQHHCGNGIKQYAHINRHIGRKLQPRVLDGDYFLISTIHHTIRKKYCQAAIRESIDDTSIEPVPNQPETEERYFLPNKPSSKNLLTVARELMLCNCIHSFFLKFVICSLRFEVMQGRCCSTISNFKLLTILIFHFTCFFHIY